MPSSLSISISVVCVEQGITKRCRQSLLTNSARIYESKCGGGGVAGSQPMSAAVHITWHGAQIKFGDLVPPYLPYGVQALRGRAVTPQLRAAREPPGGRESPSPRRGGGEGEGSLAPCLLAPRLAQPRLTTLPQGRKLPCNHGLNNYKDTKP